MNNQQQPSTSHWPPQGQPQGGAGGWGPQFNQPPTAQNYNQQQQPPQQPQQQWGQTNPQKQTPHEQQPWGGQPWGGQQPVQQQQPPQQQQFAQQPQHQQPAPWQPQPQPPQTNFSQNTQNFNNNVWGQQQQPQQQPQGGYNTQYPAQQQPQVPPPHGPPQGHTGQYQGQGGPYGGNTYGGPGVGGATQPPQPQPQQPPQQPPSGYYNPNTPFGGQVPAGGTTGAPYGQSPPQYGNVPPPPPPPPAVTAPVPAPQPLRIGSDHPLYMATSWAFVEADALTSVAWPSVCHYVLAKQFQNKAIQELVRRASDVSQASQIAELYHRHCNPRWTTADQNQALNLALQLKITQWQYLHDLVIRAPDFHIDAPQNPTTIECQIGPQLQPMLRDMQARLRSGAVPRPDPSKQLQDYQRTLQEAVLTVDMIRDWAVHGGTVDFPQVRGLYIPCTVEWPHKHYTGGFLQN